MELKDTSFRVIAPCRVSVTNLQALNIGRARQTYLGRGAKPESNESFWYNSQYILFDRELLGRDEAEYFFRFREPLALHAQQSRPVTNIGVL